MTDLSLQLIPTAHLGSFQSWVDSETRNAPTAAVRPAPQLGSTAVTIAWSQPNSLTRSEVLWRQDSYQLELVLTAPGPTQLPVLLAIATTIHSQHPD